MSLNPNAYADDRRATHFRVTFSSWVAENPAHCDRVRTDYTSEASPQTNKWTPQPFVPGPKDQGLAGGDAASRDVQNLASFVKDRAYEDI